MSTNISWLQLSDIHFRASDAWRDSAARDSLVDLLRGSFGAGTLTRPDLILCTGDIGFGDTSSQKLSSQYEDANAFFDEIQAIAGIARDHMFVVPGNHDVERAKANKHADATYRKMAKEYYLHEQEINDSVANTTKEYLDALQRLQAYRDFFSGAFPHVALDAHIHYAHRLEVNGIPLQLLGLNSAWTCSGLEEDRDVWVGAQAQISKVSRARALTIGLIHHPLEWLAKADSQLLEGRMGRDIHVLLHGHEHEFREHTFAGFPVIGAGAVSAAGQLEHGVVHCEFNLETGQLLRTLYVYSPKQAAWTRSPRCDKPLPFPHIDLELRAERLGAAGRVVKARNTYGDFFARPGRLGTLDDVSEYEEVIEPSASARNRDAEYFRHLWSDAMGPHTIEKLAGDPDAIHYDGTTSSTRVVQKDNLDAYFLRKLVVTPRLTATANEDETDKSDAAVTFDAFLKEISESPRGSKNAKDQSESENRVRYLVGDAGIGKTLTVLKVIDRLRERPEDEYGYRIHPIYLDLHGDRTWTENPPAKALQLTIEKIGASMYAALSEDARERLTFIPSSYTSASELDDAIQRLAAELARASITPFVIVDNGDRFFFENAKYRFFPEFARKRDWQLDDTFVALVDRFVSESSLGKIGASVLFVCRRYVYGHCLRVSDGADPAGPIRRDHKVYQLLPIEHDEVLESRTKLLAAAILAVDGKYRNAKMFADRLQHIEQRLGRLKAERFHGQRSVLRTVWDLVHQGHRSWLQFLATLPIDVGPGAEVAERIFDSPYLLLRLYMTNMRKRYTQKQGHFPNLFLNDARVLPRSAFEDVHREHVHTYWLKYLVLRWVKRQKVGKSKGRISSESIFDLFSKEFGYEEHLVRLAIGSLADPNTASCLRIVQPDKITRYVELLEVSRRGEILVEPSQQDNPLCFSFDYLQLITDDYLLALPRVVADEIYVDADLGHSLKSGSAYSRGSRTTLRKKIPAVLTFFRVLQISFDKEMAFRSITSKVRTLGIGPDFPLLQENLLDAIARLDSHFEDFRDQESMPNPRALWNALTKDDRIEQSLAHYYQSPRLVTV